MFKGNAAQQENMKYKNQQITAFDTRRKKQKSLTLLLQKRYEYIQGQ